MRGARIAVLVLVAVILVGPAPWTVRRRAGMRPNRLLADRVLVEDWPAEPPSPPAATLDRARFARALQDLCFSMNAERARRYAGWILDAAQGFHADPFLVAAILYRESRCSPDPAPNPRLGAGPMRIVWDWHHEHIRGGHLEYPIDATRTARVPVPRFPFGPMRLETPEASIYFGAALLAMWEAQHTYVDASFEQAAHRHAVSHYLWGDRVRSDLEEERVLADRRRVLEHYTGHDGAPTIRFHDVEFGCPLFGCPRMVLSWLGAERSGGRREHRGIDVDSLPEEPVRAAADGVVTFAGVDLPGSREHVQVRSEEGYAAFDRDGMGAGGRYVCIRHGVGAEYVISCSMHLERVRVAQGDQVRRGQVIGTVGRTGMRASAAHLHFELHTAERLEDPSTVLGGLFLGRRATDPQRR